MTKRTVKGYATLGATCLVLLVACTAVGWAVGNVLAGFLTSLFLIAAIPIFWGDDE